MNVKYIEGEVVLKTHCFLLLVMEWYWCRSLNTREKESVY